MLRFTAKNGFSLIEILVVIAILGLLASIILSSVNDARSKARDAERISHFAQMRRALELYYDEWERYPTPIGYAFDVGTGGNNAYGYYTTHPASWGALTGALEPFIDVPIDPVNTGFPVSSGGLAYLYMVNGKGSAYDLIGRLENNHPLSCQSGTDEKWPIHVPNIAWNPASGYWCAIGGLGTFADH